jgi:hypothetical protein
MDPKAIRAEPRAARRSRTLLHNHTPQTRGLLKQLIIGRLVDVRERCVCCSGCALRIRNLSSSIAEFT